MRSALGLVLGTLAALGCSGAYESLDERDCPDGSTTLTYETFGAPFLAVYCEGCHGADAVDRRGAPGEYVFDTHEQVTRHRARIFVRAAGGNDSMPPGPDDPSPGERELLAEWLACGAP